MKAHAWMIAIVAAVVACLLGCVTAGIVVTKNLTANLTAEATTAETPQNDGILTLFDTDSVRIELEGAETRVYDLVGGAEYTFNTTRTVRTTPLTLEERQSRALGRTVTDTETMKIELAGGLIVVHDLTAEQTYYISR